MVRRDAEGILTGRGMVAVIAIVGAGLAAIAAWCVWVIVSTGDTRREVERNVGVLSSLVALRTAVEQAGADLPGLVPDARRLAIELAGVPEAQAEARQLAPLLASAGPDVRPRFSAVADRITRAVRARNRALSIDLGRHWGYLNGVAVFVVVLAASQLGLIVLSHRRRLRAEAGEATLRARNDALEQVTARWASGDLTATVEAPATGGDFEATLEALRLAMARHVAELERRAREVQDLVEDLRIQLVRKTEQLAAAAPGDAAVEPGRMIAGRYELGRVLGAGGMGTVYRARRLADDRSVALKLMLDPRDEHRRARFLREARLLAEVHDPNVVRILDVDLHGGQPFFVTELIEGKNLAECDAWTIEAALPVLRAIVAGLDAIHARGIIHRDLKLANVMIGLGRGGEGVVKIVDFGIAFDAGPAPEEPSSPFSEAGSDEQATVETAVVRTGAPTTSLTSDSVVVGTLRYMAPESRLRIPLTTAADIFAFGVVATRLLTSDFPWDTPPITLVKRSGGLPPPRFANEQVPPWLRDLVVACLDQDPLARPTASALTAVLERRRPDLQ